MAVSSSFQFYASLLVSMITTKLAHHLPVFWLFTGGLLWVAYRNLTTPGWPTSGEVSAASIIAITVIASLPSALGLV